MTRLLGVTLIAAITGGIGYWEWLEARPLARTHFEGTRCPAAEIARSSRTLRVNLGRGRSQDAYDDRVIVVLREGAPARAIEHVASAVGGCLEDSVEPIKAYRIRIPPVDSEKKLFQIISRIKDLPEVETAEPSFVLQIQ